MGIGLAVVFAVIAVSPALAGDTDMAGRAQRWETSFNSGDADAIAALYTEDSIRMPYQAPALEGRDAIVENIKETFALGIVAIKLEVHGDEAQGKLAWGYGTYALMDSDGNTVQTGKWMNVSKKVGKTWLIHSDIWNTDEPEE
jgi:ketosteroid isomerase-like protein